MKVWIGLLCFVLGVYAAEQKYALEDLTVREDGLLVETKTLKLANGIGQFFYESGKLKSETPFKEGIREGLGKTYYESGKVQSQTPFKNNRPDGIAKLFSPKSQLIRTIEFKEGEVIQGFDYDAKGKKKELSLEELIEAIKVF